MSSSQVTGIAPRPSRPEQNRRETGLNVSELKAEMMVETAMVRANWRKELADDSRHERTGNKNGRQNQAHGDDGTGDLILA